MIRPGRVEIGNWFPQFSLPAACCRWKNVGKSLRCWSELTRFCESSLLSRISLVVSVCDSGMRVPLKNMSDDCDLAGWQWPRSVGNLAKPLLLVYL